MLGGVPRTQRHLSETQLLRVDVDGVKRPHVLESVRHSGWGKKCSMSGRFEAGQHARSPGKECGFCVTVFLHMLSTAEL